MSGFAPQPKPRPRVLDRIAYRKDREAKHRAFVAAVWVRDGGLCRHCGRKVLKTMQAVPSRGEVHHIHGRNVAPADRYNPKAAVLLCLLCHKDPAVIARFRRFH